MFKFLCFKTEDGTGSVPNFLKMSSNRQPTFDLFQPLSVDVMGEILSHLDTLDIVFTIGFVCKTWRHDHAWHYLSHSITNISNLESFDELFITRKGRAHIRTCIRKYIYDMAVELQTHTKSTSFFSSCSSSSNMNGFLDKVQELKFYMSHFRDYIEDHPKVTPQPAENHIPERYSFSGFLSGLTNKISTTWNNYFTATEKSQPNKEYEYSIKCVLTGRFHTKQQ